MVPPLYTVGLMDYVFVEGVRCQAAHGHYPIERTRPQEFVVDAKVGVDAAPAGTSDELRETIDYDWIKRCVEGVFAGKSRYLVEKLAQEIVDALFADARVRTAEVTIRKTEVWDNGVPGVTVSRSSPR